MFESRERLAAEILGLLDTIRRLGEARYACLLEARGIIFESPEAPGEAWPLRQLLAQRRRALFAIPRGLASGDPIEDVFGGWDEDEFLLAFINGRVALVVACPQAEALRERARRPLEALADRLFRYDEKYRLDPQGRGFFMGSAQLELVVVGRPG